MTMTLADYDRNDSPFRGLPTTGPEIGSLWERDDERRLVQYVYADGNPVLVLFAYTYLNCGAGTACWSLRLWLDWASGAVCLCEGFER